MNVTEFMFYEKNKYFLRARFGGTFSLYIWLLEKSLSEISNALMLQCMEIGRRPQELSITLSSAAESSLLHAGVICMSPAEEKKKPTYSEDVHKKVICLQADIGMTISFAYPGFVVRSI